MTQYGAQTPPPGWYPDPMNGAPRYWDGAQWGPYWTGPAWQPVVARPTTTAAVLAHLGAFFGGFLLPLIVFLVTDRSERFTRTHAAEALNFQLTVLIVAFAAALAAIVLTVLTAGIALVVLVPAFLAAWVVHIVWAIKAAVAASRYEYWYYPLNFRMVHP